MFWLSYLTYLEERGKSQTTRKVLLCALQCLMPGPDSDRIWGKFCDSGRPVMGAASFLADALAQLEDDAPPQDELQLEDLLFNPATLAYSLAACEVQTNPATLAC